MGRNRAAFVRATMGDPQERGGARGKPLPTRSPLPPSSLPPLRWSCTALEAPGTGALGWSVPLPLSEGAHGPEDATGIHLLGFICFSEAETEAAHFWDCGCV